MLKEKKNIDQLFLDKLGGYEKDPPPYLWENIRKNLDDQKKGRKFAMLKNVGIAAAIVLSLLAGWMMTKVSDIPTKNKYAIENSKPSSGKIENTEENTASLAPNTETNENQIASLSPTSEKVGRSTPVKSNLNNELTDDGQVQKEMILNGTEEKFMNSLKVNPELNNKPNDILDSKKSETGIHDSDKPMVKSPTESNSNKQQFAYNGNQEKDARSAMESNKKSKWSLKAEISPLYTNEKTDANSIASNYSLDTKSENTLSGGMVASYKISDRLSFKSGIIYSELKQTTQYPPPVFTGADNVYTNAGVLYSSGSIRGGHSTPMGIVQSSKSASSKMENLSGLTSQKAIPDINITQDIGYLEIPVAATYKLIDRKIDVGLSAGLSTNLLVGNSASINQNGSRIASGETASLRDVVYSGTAGLEIGYEISNRISLTVEPRLKRFINSISENESVDFKPYQIGIYTGVSYKFN